MPRSDQHLLRRVYPRFEQRKWVLECTCGETFIADDVIGCHRLHEIHVIGTYDEMSQLR